MPPITPSLPPNAAAPQQIGRRGVRYCPTSAVIHVFCGAIEGLFDAHACGVRGRQPWVLSGSYEWKIQGDKAVKCSLGYAYSWSTMIR